MRRGVNANGGGKRRGRREQDPVHVGRAPSTVLGRFWHTTARDLTAKLTRGKENKTTDTRKDVFLIIRCRRTTDRQTNNGPTDSCRWKTSISDLCAPYFFYPLHTVSLPVFPCSCCVARRKLSRPKLSFAPTCFLFTRAFQLRSLWKGLLEPRKPALSDKEIAGESKERARRKRNRTEHRENKTRTQER
jgi:hypothetical protein